MQLTELIKQVNDLIDDSLSSDQITGWLNAGLAEVGSQVNAVFPVLSLNDSTGSPAIPDKWQRILLVPYAAAKAKQQDSSQFEYMDLYNQYSANLEDFRVKYDPPLKYRELAYGQDITLPNDDVYTTESGDTLDKIATDNTTTVQAILDVVGQEITYYGDQSEANIFDTAPYPFWGSW